MKNKNIISLYPCALILLCSVTLYSSDIMRLLEAGKLQNAKTEIEKVKDINVKNYLSGIYYMFCGEYQQAEDCITMIPSELIKPDSIELFYYKYIPGLNKTISNGYQKYESEHFIVYLKNEDIILKDVIIPQLEKIYNSYKQLLNYAPEDKVRVEVYNTKQEFAFCSTLGEEIIKKTGVVGICKFNRLMIMSPGILPYGYRWVDTLAHEYLHFILNRKTEFNLPLYLHEGISRYFDTLYRSTNTLCLTAGNINLLVNAKKNNKIIPFTRMQGSLVYLDSQEEMELAFTELATYIDYLYKSFGREKLLSFIESFKDEKDDIKNYNKVYKINFSSLYSQWEQSIDVLEEIAKQYPGAKADIKFINREDEKNLIGLNIEGYINLGDKFVNSKNYKIALYQYNKAAKIEEYNPIVMTKIAKVYMLQQKYSEAENVLKKCINVNPNFVTAYEILVKLYYEQGMYENAMVLFQTILDINPFNYEIRKLVAEMFTDLGKIKNAIEEYKVVKILNPKDTEIDNIISSLEQYLDIKKNPK